MCPLSRHHGPSSLATTQFLLLAFIYHTHGKVLSTRRGREGETYQPIVACFLVLENSIKLTVTVPATPGHSALGIKDNISGREGGRRVGVGQCVSVEGLKVNNEN